MVVYWLRFTMLTLFLIPWIVYTCRNNRGATRNVPSAYQCLHYFGKLIFHLVEKRRILSLVHCHTTRIVHPQVLLFITVVFLDVGVFGTVFSFLWILRITCFIALTEQSLPRIASLQIDVALHMMFCGLLSAWCSLSFTIYITLRTSFRSTRNVITFRHFQNCISRLSFLRLPFPCSIGILLATSLLPAYSLQMLVVSWENFFLPFREILTKCMIKIRWMVKEQSLYNNNNV